MSYAPLFSFWILLLLGLSACNTSTERGSVAVAASPTVTLALPSSTVTAIPTATPTRTLFPTPHLVPTRTPTSTPTITPTATFTPIPTRTPDPEGYDYRYDLPSPDGQWIAVIKTKAFIFEENQKYALTVVNVTTGETILIKEKIRGAAEPLVTEAPHPLHWSLDSQRFYYSYQPTYRDGCDPYTPSTLHVYDLGTATDQTIVDEMAESITFAPTMDKVAYFPYKALYENEGTPSVAIYDLLTGAEREIPIHQAALLPENRADVTGNIIWHPDGQHLVLSVIVEPCIADQQALILLDATTMEQRLLTLGGPHWYSIVRWEDDNTLLIQEGGDYWTYNMDFGDWIPANIPE